jgi:hypothetical protein
MNSDTGSPQLDFSERAARRAAFFDIVQHPLTLWPPAVGTATAVGFALFGIASGPFSAAIAVGGIGVGVANWAYRFFGRGDAYMQKHYADLHEQFEKLKRQKTAELAATSRSWDASRERRRSRNSRISFRTSWPSFAGSCRKMN